LLFNTFPDVVDHIAGLTIMGGAVGGGFTKAPMGSLEGEGERFGNWTPWSEFNIYIDPESAQSIFSNPVLAAKTTIAPLDLTHQMVSVLAKSHIILSANILDSWQHQKSVKSYSMDLTRRW
jgi:uridine nucleosidase